MTFFVVLEKKNRTMKQIICHKWLVKQTLLLFLGITLGCSKNKFDWVYNELEVIVVDKKGFPIQNAEVTLYRTETDFKEGRQPLRTGILTDENGSVVLKKLDLNTKTFYVEATKGEANNWGKNGKISDFEQFERRKKVIYLEKAPLVNYLAGRSEKRWKLVYQIINTTQYNGCEIYSFNRDKRIYYSYYKVPYSCFGEHQNGSFRFWSLNELGNSFRIFNNKQGGVLFEEAQIIEMTDSTLIYRHKPANEPDAPFYITKKLRLDN